ncbi:uncharacterized protein [Castor canadensis]|uniref:Uncharacterized protein n=1 Tax=Castor canadensis TaxID=51338 RepID=A0AC58K2G9_CASCN
MVASGLVAGGARKPGGRAGKRKGWGGGGGAGEGPGWGRGEERGPSAGDLAESAPRRAAPELWACALPSGEEGALLRFYFSMADHVENNNSLGRGQRQLVLLGAPSAAAGSLARASLAPPRPQPCALDWARAPGAAERRPASRTGAARGHREARPWAAGVRSRGASRLGANSAGPGRGTKAPSLGGGSRECAPSTRAPPWPGTPGPARGTSFNLSELTQGAPSCGRPPQRRECKDGCAGGSPKTSGAVGGRRPSACVSGIMGLGTWHTEPLRGH